MMSEPTLWTNRLASLEARLRELSTELNAIQTIIRVKLPNDELNELHSRRATWDLYMALTQCLNSMLGALSGNPGQVEAAGDIDLIRLSVQLPTDEECLKLLTRLADILRETVEIVLSVAQEKKRQIGILGAEPRVIQSGIVPAPQGGPAAPDGEKKAAG
jgi:hypothetical protein